MENRHLVGSILALGLVVVALILALDVRNTGHKDTLSVGGMSQMSVAPDKAEVYIAIETSNATAKESQAENKEISAKVLEALKSAGVADSDIETDSYTIYPKEVWDDKLQDTKLVGYTVSNVLKVTTKDVSGTGMYIDVSVEAGANRIDRVIFSLTKEKEKEVMAELLNRASANAKEKAGTIASGMGVSLGKIASISESNFNVQPYPIYMNRYASSMDKAESTSISPKNVETSAYITVVYLI